MKSSGIQDIIFPMIGQAIEETHRDHQKFVTREEIKRKLLRDMKSRKEIEVAYRETAGKMSIEKYAGNLVDFFSKSRTLGEAKWLTLFSKFERSEKKIDGRWAYRPLNPSAIVVFPDEIDEEDAKTLPEGAVTKRLVNKFERNAVARERCIKKYGPICTVCGFSFGATYGTVVSGFIHVHHLLQLSEVGTAYKVDPIADLRPVCANCHAVIHHRPGRAYTIEEVRSFLQR
jgi:predicted HNH restriction endonuclease